MILGPVPASPSTLAINAARCEKSLVLFTESAWPTIEPAKFTGNWHIDAICDHLTAVADRQVKRLLINIPPRHAKSQTANVYFPAWVWAQSTGLDENGQPQAIKPGTWRGPGVKFMHLSYVADLSTRDSVRCRQVIDSKWYQSRWGDRFSFTSDQNQKTAFVNTRGGERLSRAVGGRVTGDGADIIIFDDPHNVKDGESPVEREKVLRFWDESMPTRLNDAEQGAFIVIMQRVHEKDLSGHILAKEMDWTHLCLPARYEPDHPTLSRTRVLRSRASNDGGKPGTVWEDLRAPDQPLFEARFKESTLETWAKEMGSYAAAGQLQQRPAPRVGGVFQRDWFEIVPAAPASATVKVRAWDLAGTEENIKSDPDWSVGLKMSRDPVSGIMYIEHIARDRKSPLGVEQMIKNTASQDGRQCIVRLPQDPAQAGKFQVAKFASLLIGYRIRTEREEDTKELRADSFSAQCEVGNVKLVRGTWNDAFLDELCAFPNGSHDDQVDAATAAFRAIADFANPRALSGRQYHHG